MNDRERIVQVLKDQIALCGPDPERDRWWVTFTADDARWILEILSRQEQTQCKDCKQGEQSVLPNRHLWCRIHEFYREPDWFCADGESKEGR